MKVGDKIKRKTTKKTRPNPHPVYTIKEIFHSQGFNFYVLEDDKGKKFTMVEAGVINSHEIIPDKV